MPYRPMRLSPQGNGNQTFMMCQKMTNHGQAMKMPLKLEAWDHRGLVNI